MAGRGPAPKDPSARVRRNKTAPVVALPESVDELRGMDLPDDFAWSPQTRKWWETWRRSPQSLTFTDTDWSFLLDTALMHHAMWSKGQWTLAAEVRLRVAKFGATPEDRARLRLSIGEPKKAAPAKTQTRASTDRRERLLKAVGDVG